MSINRTIIIEDGTLWAELDALESVIRSQGRAADTALCLLYLDLCPYWGDADDVQYTILDVLADRFDIYAGDYVTAAPALEDDADWKELTIDEQMERRIEREEIYSHCARIPASWDFNLESFCDACRDAAEGDIS